MKCHGYCQPTFQYRIHNLTGNADINSIHRTFRYLLSIEVAVAELRKVCHCELRRIAQSTITAGEKALQREKSRTRAREGGMEHDRLGDRGFDRRHGKERKKASEFGRRVGKKEGVYVREK